MKLYVASQKMKNDQELFSTGRTAGQGLRSQRLVSEQKSVLQQDDGVSSRRGATTYQLLRTEN
jgi:hypothetical protein